MRKRPKFVSMILIGLVTVLMLPFWIVIGILTIINRVRILRTTRKVEDDVE